MRLGVFLPNWVGDVVMATPAIRALRMHAGDGALVGVMRPYVAEVLDGNSWFDASIVYAKGQGDAIAALVAAALRRPKRRVKTRPSTGARESRLAQKKRRGADKRLRGGLSEAD